jgi:hypothetical protein
MPRSPYSPSEIAAMRERAHQGATLSQIMMEFDRSRPTVCKHTKGINRHRRVHMKVKAARRPVTLAGRAFISAALDALTAPLPSEPSP